MVVMSRRVVPAAGALYWKRVSDSGVCAGRVYSPETLAPSAPVMAQIFTTM